VSLHSNSAATLRLLVCVYVRWTIFFIIGAVHKWRTFGSAAHRENSQMNLSLRNQPGGAFSDHSCRRHSRTALIYIFLKPDILINISVYIFSLRKQQEEKQESSNDEYVYTFSRHGAPHAHTHIHAGAFSTLRFIISFDSQHSQEILVIRSFFDTYVYVLTNRK
jgi:hypothetical protein